jgi:signal transduction histidine kinase
MNKELSLQNEIKKLTSERNLFAKLLEESNLQYEGKIKELSLLRRIGDIISDSFNIKSFCHKLVQIIIEETDAENCSLLLKDRKSKKLTLKVAYGIRDKRIAFFEDLKESKVIFAVGEGIAGKVALEGKPIMINDVREDERFDHSNKRNLPIGSILCCPIIVQNEILGVINLSNSHTCAFSSDDMRSITIFSAFASSILNNAILYNELTGVNKRRKKAFDILMVTQKQLKLEIDERKAAEQNLIDYQKRLKALTTELILTEQKQRHDFADYLHDEIGQQLFATRLQLEQLKESLSSSKDKNILENAVNTLNLVIDQSRSLTTELGPPILYELGLEKALDWLTEQAHKKYDLIVAFHDDNKKKPLEDEVKIFLYQAVSELLMNVAKHAKTKNVRVSVKRDDANIRIRVEDSGVGFSVSNGDYSGATRGGGIGLFRIKERAEQLGGRVKITSQTNHGTYITLVLPLDNNFQEKIT